MAEGHKQEEAAMKLDAKRFADQFSREHGIEIVFDEAACARLVERAQAERMTDAGIVRASVQGFSFRPQSDREKHGAEKLRS